MEVTDSEFLSELRERLMYVYGGKSHLDYISRLGEIISKLEEQELKQKYSDNKYQNQIEYHVHVTLDVDDSALVALKQDLERQIVDIVKRPYT